MSTRAMYTFRDETGEYHVDKHSDGYPTGAAEALINALPHAWQLPRFEADEFAAAFVAANKSYWHNQEFAALRALQVSPLCEEAKAQIARCRKYAEYNGGGVRLMNSGSVYAVAPCDIEYRYEVTCKAGKLQVKAFSTSFWDVRSKKNEKRIFQGTLAGFKEAAAELERPGGCGAARVGVYWTAESRNKKTGPIPVSTTSAETCPSACPLAKDGCYAKAGNVGILWHALTRHGPNAAWKHGASMARSIDWAQLCERVGALPEGALWRHNQAGDLPHRAQRISKGMLQRLVAANRGRRGFTYTHHDVVAGAWNRALVRWANATGFTINLSGNDLGHADKLADMGVGPVVVILAQGAGDARTPAGRPVKVCPAVVREGITCSTCQWCAMPERGWIVGFPAHGSGARAADAIAAG